ncbi:GTP cyclohydrolase I FolE [Sorangium sp. KYC3313]|uniref:GTP cyclohydrolase I FolE n=1 Tax=Sorangium sp. KYC3313 TaxID=3449740 RepID=UPI003F8C5917
MQRLVREIISELGEDADREGLRRTPERVARAFEFFASGYGVDVESLVKDAKFSLEANHMILVRNIEIYSLCEHHLLPFFGRCHIGYVPDKTVCGVSKLARIADAYARRLQIQERMTDQVAGSIMELIKPKGVGVVIEARHLCMMMRGVEKQNSVMVTSAVLGSFRESHATRTEFLSLIDRAPP